MTYYVLVADDEPNICELMEMYIGVAYDDIKTHTVANGKIAVEMYAQLACEGMRPDLVLMDIRMPVMDGIEATRRILEVDPDAKIYMVTAYYEQDLIEGAMNAGAKGVINKIREFKKIAKTVRGLLES
jgi:CheY-like chemotaxis protein